MKHTLKICYICPFVVIDPTDLGATVVVAQALCLTIFDLSPTQQACLFTDGNRAGVCDSGASACSTCSSGSYYSSTGTPTIQGLRFTIERLICILSRVVCIVYGLLVVPVNCFVCLYVANLALSILFIFGIVNVVPARHVVCQLHFAVMPYRPLLQAALPACLAAQDPIAR